MTYRLWGVVLFFFNFFKPRMISSVSFSTSFQAEFKATSPVALGSFCLNGTFQSQKPTSRKGEKISLTKRVTTAKSNANNITNNKVIIINANNITNNNKEIKEIIHKTIAQKEYRIVVKNPMKQRFPSLRVAFRVGVDHPSSFPLFMVGNIDRS